MSRKVGGTGFGRVFVEAGRLIGDHPVILIPAVLPALWIFIAPLVRLVSVRALFAAYYAGFGAGAWRLFVFLLVYVVLLVLSQGLTVILVRNAAESGSAELAKGFEEGSGRSAPLLIASLSAALVVAVGSLVFVFPGLVAVFFFWYIVQAILIDGETAIGAFRSSFRFAATFAGETFAIILAALVLGFAFIYIPQVGWLLTIPVTGYFVTMSTLLFIERET